MDIHKLNPACEKCGLCKVATKVCIPGRGVGFKPKILFVGQAPGEDEDARGKVFCGRAGELLQQAIDEFDLNPNYITNAVKCFPGKKLAGGGDNEPTKEQIKACLPYLEEEIKALDPDFIVCLGNVALKALAGKSGITTWSGRVVGKRGRATLFGLLHPSYVLRSPGVLARFESDCKNLRALIHPEEKRKHPLVHKLNPKSVPSTLVSLNEPIAFDYETTDKKFEGNRIRCFSFADANRAYWVDCEADPEAGMEALRQLVQYRAKKIAHNAIFEGRWSIGLFGVLPFGLCFDTMLEAHLYDEDGPKALDILAAKWLDAPGWDIAPLMEEKGWTYETVPMEVLGPYNALDSLYTRRLHDVLWAKMAEPLRKAHNEVVLPVAKQCAKFQHRGVKLDKQWTSEVLRRYRKEMEALEAKFRALPSVKKFEAKLLDEGKKLNLNSPPQMSRLFFRRMGLPVFERTPAGKPSAREPALLRIPNPPAEVTLYLGWKGHQTVANNYLEKFPRFCDKKGLIHADFNPARIVTGRIAITDPPTGTLPDDPLVRGMLVSRWEGGQIASADYKQLELYLVASESGDDLFLRAILEGADAHNDTAAAIWPGKWHGKDHCESCIQYRAIAKRINFGIVYGVTEYKIAREFGIPIDEAARIIAGMRRAHPKIFLWMTRQHEMAKKYGYVESRFGRRRHLPGIERMPEKLAAEALRQAGNFPIQSAGADITSTACIILEREMRAREMKSLLISHNHDALVVDVHPKELHSVPELIVQCMENKTQAKCPWLKVPLRVDVKISKHYAGAEDPWQTTK